MPAFLFRRFMQGWHHIRVSPVLLTATSTASAAAATNICQVRLALPTGRLQTGVLDLLAEAGIAVTKAARNYRPTVSLPGVTAKFLKPQTIPNLIALGVCDVGFCGADWAFESGGDLTELCDTGLNPVTLVAAAPKMLLSGGQLPDRPLIVASEYERWTRQWIASRGINASLVLTRGTTEALPPEDADVIVDNTSTGATLAANDLQIVEKIFVSTTRLYANQNALRDLRKRQVIDEMVRCLSGVVKQ